MVFSGYQHNYSFHGSVLIIYSSLFVGSYKFMNAKVEVNAAARTVISRLYFPTRISSPLLRIRPSGADVVPYH